MAIAQSASSQRPGLGRAASTATNGKLSPAARIAISQVTLRGLRSGPIRARDTRYRVLYRYTGKKIPGGAGTRSPPPSTAPCGRLVSTHARRPPMTPPGMASRGPPPGPSLLTIARLSQRPSFSRTRDYHISRCTRHELQAHHGHVALLNRPRAGSALVCEVLCECECVSVCDF